MKLRKRLNLSTVLLVGVVQYNNPYINYMKRLDKIHKADYKFVPVDPDPNFDPEHNRRIIEKTIRESDANRNKKHREAVGAAQERGAALAVYLKGLEKGRTTSNMMKFFGKKELLRLRGNEIRDRLDQLRVLSADGKIMRKVPQ